MAIYLTNYISPFCRFFLVQCWLKPGVISKALVSGFCWTSIFPISFKSLLNLLTIELVCLAFSLLTCPCQVPEWFSCPLEFWNLFIHGYVGFQVSSFLLPHCLSHMFCPSYSPFLSPNFPFLLPAFLPFSFLPSFFPIHPSLHSPPSSFSLLFFPSFHLSLFSLPLVLSRLWPNFFFFVCISLPHIFFYLDSYPHTSPFFCCRGSL